MHLGALVLSACTPPANTAVVMPCCCCFTLAASAPDEFALLRQLLPLHRSGSLDLQLHTTQSHGLVVAEDAAHSPQVVQGRVCEQHLATALKQLQSGSSSGMQDIAAYVCGPPKMTDNVVHMLFGLGLPEAAVHTERWW